MKGLTKVKEDLKEKLSEICSFTPSGWRLNGITLGGITRENRDERFGHLFTVQFLLNYQPQRKFVDIVQMLQWNEVIYHFERDANNNWMQIRKQNTNKYKENPQSNTFSLWQNLYRGNGTTETVFAREGGDLEGLIQDKPAISTGANRDRTLRRVIHFDIGLKGFAQRVQGAQILEIVEGNITIYQFINQRIEQVKVNDPRLEQWRTEWQNEQQNEE